MKRKKAERLAAQHKFERFYETWDESKPSERLDPDSDPSIAGRFTLAGWRASIPSHENA